MPDQRVALLRVRRGDEPGNAAMLAPALAAAGHACVPLDIDSILFDGALLCARDDAGQLHALADFDRIWLLGFGQQATTLDRFQLLAAHLPARRFVNAPAGIMAQHAKHALTSVPEPLRLPESRVGNDSDWLLMQIRDGSDWILKPTGGSFGRGVVLLAADNPGAAAAAIRTAIGPQPGRYVQVQRRVDTGAGELRVLLAAGKVIGAYRRMGAPGAIAGNLAQGGQATATQLDSTITGACERLAAQLRSAGIDWAGIDLAWPWVMEVNVANPGGLTTLATLGDSGAARRTVQALSADWQSA